MYAARPVQHQQIVTSSSSAPEQVSVTLDFFSPCSLIFVAHFGKSQLISLMKSCNACFLLVVLPFILYRESHMEDHLISKLVDPSLFLIFDSIQYLIICIHSSRHFYKSDTSAAQKKLQIKNIPHMPNKTSPFPNFTAVSTNAEQVL